MNRQPFFRALGLALGACVLVACGVARMDDSSDTTAVGPGSTTVVVDGLDHPTQIADGPDGTLLVAQLAGGEGDGTGEVLAVDLTTVFVSRDQQQSDTARALGLTTD